MMNHTEPLYCTYYSHTTPPHAPHSHTQTSRMMFVNITRTALRHNTNVFSISTVQSPSDVLCGSNNNDLMTT